MSRLTFHLVDGEYAHFDVTAAKHPQHDQAEVLNPESGMVGLRFIAPDDGIEISPHDARAVAHLLMAEADEAERKL